MEKASLFKNKRITVFGLGMNMGGVGTALFLVSQGAKEVIVTDIKKKEELASSVAKLKECKNITFVLGAHRPEDFTRVDMVIKNPVIPWTNEYVELARRNGIPVEMDSSLFMKLCPAPVIGVTGTKGKTTTASLIAHILSAAGKSVVKVGISQTGVLSELSKITKESVVVFEFSSWRLSALASLKKSPHIAVITNLYPDHQNYYRSLRNYYADKANIFRFQKTKDFLIANADNEAMREIAQDAPGQLLWFSAAGKTEVPGAWAEDDVIMYEDQEAARVLFPLEKIQLQGKHNQANVLAASLACLAYGLKPKDIRTGVETFSGVKHRMELVAEHEGVRYINDSAATIPEAAFEAIRSFDAGKLILLGGGSDKELDFTGFAEALRPLKRVILFAGAGTEKILKALEGKLGEEEQSRFSVVSSMAEALAEAGAVAENGDTVLLSPGAASFGVFQNEFDRGDQFRAQAQAL